MPICSTWNSEYSYADRDDAKINSIRPPIFPGSFQAWTSSGKRNSAPSHHGQFEWDSKRGRRCISNPSVTRFRKRARFAAALICAKTTLTSRSLSGVDRPFKFGEHMALTPKLELFNAFKHKTMSNPLSTPALFTYDGFLRQGSAIRGQRICR